MNTTLYVNQGLSIASSAEALDHIAEFLLAEGVVKPSYPAAVKAREAEFPTGIDLGFAAVAIPHCDASHANKPALYLIQPEKPVPFQQADGDDLIDAKLIIALVVTDPKDQLVLLRTLFGSLQDEDFVNALCQANTEAELAQRFREQILPQ